VKHERSVKGPIIFEGQIRNLSLTGLPGTEDRELLANRARAPDVGFIGFQDNNIAREACAPISCRDFQPAESREFQHAKSDYVYSVRYINKDVRHGTRDYQHFDNVATGSIWIEVDLVRGSPMALPRYPARQFYRRSGLFLSN